ncbi:MAG: zinc transport system substrate-binding protein, partial [Cellvibrionaceae bacterium]
MTNKQKNYIPLHLVFTALLLSSTGALSQTQVLVSIRPLALLVQDLVLSGDSVEQLLPTTASPHHYALNISDRQKIAEADLVFWIGPELESFLRKALSNHPRISTLSRLNTLVWAPALQADSRQNHHDHSGRDYHLWLNPLNLMALARAITDDLIARSPERAAAYENRLARLLDRLARVDRELVEQLAAVRDKPFIVLHPAYDHFIEHYELTQVDYVVKIPGASLSAKHRYKLQKLEEIVCIFGEEGQRPKRLEQLSKQLNVRAIILD